MRRHLCWSTLHDLLPPESSRISFRIHSPLSYYSRSRVSLSHAPSHFHRLPLSLRPLFAHPPFSATTPSPDGARTRTQKRVFLFWFSRCCRRVVPCPVSTLLAGRCRYCRCCEDSLAHLFLSLFFFFGTSDAFDGFSAADPPSAHPSTYASLRLSLSFCGSI